MKKITCGIIAMLSVVTLHSQDSGSELYTTEVDKKIENLNKTSITSNILIDRVLSVSDILSFNQEARKDTTSYEHFKQVWYELYQASYVKNFSSLEEFNDKLKFKNYSTNTVPIGIINTEFHYGDAGTTQNPNVGFNSSTQTFYNISGKNPFFKKQATIISPLLGLRLLSIMSMALFFIPENNISLPPLHIITPVTYHDPSVNSLAVTLYRKTTLKSP